MAWIKTYDVKGGRRYRVYWREPDGAQSGKVFRRSADAQSFKREVEHRLDVGTYTDPRRGRITLAELWTEFNETTANVLAPSTRSLYRMQWTRHIEPHLGARRINSLEPNDIRGFIADLERGGLRPASVNATFRLLRRLLSLAVLDDRIARNPASRVTPPRSTPRQIRPLTPEEVERVSSEMTPEYAVLVMTLGYTGIRIGEAAALRIRNLNTMKRTLSVVEAAAEVAGQRIVGETKTRRKRTAMMPVFLAEMLAEHLARQERADQPDALVFTSRDGAPLSQHAFRRVFQRACRRAGIHPVPRVHDLRHTAATIAISAGAHAKLVQDLLGHSGIGTTMNVYAHVFESMHTDLADRLDAVRAAARGEHTEGVVLPFPHESDEPQRGASS